MNSEKIPKRERGISSKQIKKIEKAVKNLPETRKILEEKRRQELEEKHKLRERTINRVTNIF